MSKVPEGDERLRPIKWRADTGCNLGASSQDGCGHAPTKRVNVLAVVVGRFVAPAESGPSTAQPAGWSAVKTESRLHHRLRVAGAAQTRWVRRGLVDTRGTCDVVPHESCTS
jgi:hypothetical protein